MPVSEAVSPVPPSTAAGRATPPVPCDSRPVEELLALYKGKGLVEVSTLINVITDFNELLTGIMDVARRVVRAEGSALFLLDEPSGELRLVIARSATGEVIFAHQAVPRQGAVAGWVFEHGERALIPDAYADPRFYSGIDLGTGYRTHAILCVPPCRRGQPIGALQVLNPLGADRPGFDAADQDALESEQRRRARFEQEMLIAAEIQKNFLPAELPVRPDLTFAARYRPAMDVGGDFCDVYEGGLHRRADRQPQRGGRGLATRPGGGTPSACERVCQSATCCGNTLPRGSLSPGRLPSARRPHPAGVRIPCMNPPLPVSPWRLPA